MPETERQHCNDNDFARGREGRAPLPSAPLNRARNKTAQWGGRRRIRAPSRVTIGRAVRTPYVRSGSRQLLHPISTCRHKSCTLNSFCRRGDDLYGY